MDGKPMEAWMGVLDRIEEAVRQSLARAADPPEPPAPPPGEGPLERLDARLRSWEASLARIEQEATSASRAFNAEEEALSEWKAALARLRQEASAWLGRAG